MAAEVVVEDLQVFERGVGLLTTVEVGGGVDRPAGPNESPG
jgi:hypothetical protein